ncbi:hypothetical protein DBT_1181 [Dissulfuribacter thermophilus]|uniref:Uncharacterized protein n=1 Tax=Dissulfuribacter thermophilus TaxID=1156395 RepID=A0A1B9F6H1_9BACT|nr:hypothetical protein DBT_1181 [Dissulfuribacter thermophilus]
MSSVGKGQLPWRIETMWLGKAICKLSQRILDPRWRAIKTGRWGAL